ncbi:MAG TPA: FemAB family XrtA/PEP-CTERM system-associated protein, partial [Novosphingobium sp.]|nr:FemAB family XrtA/PEP-CTERM system-associated protein [Novosphingobium sp.]
MNAPHPGLASTVRRARFEQADERTRIAAFLATQPDASPFHSTDWLAAVERATGHEAHALLCEERGEIVGFLPLHAVRSALFGHALVSTGFAVGGGILAGTPRVAERLAAAAEELAGRLACPTIELRGGVLPRRRDWDEITGAHAGFSAPLAVDDEAQLLAIPRKQRAEVRKGLANGLEFRVGRDARDRAEHHAVYSESVRNLGTPVFPRALFEAVLDGFGDAADILTVRRDGAPLASVLSLYHRGAVMPYWGGGTSEARAARANDVMYYALMNHARERGCSRFDFGRSKVGSGAWHFKRNWGFVPQPLVYARWTAS